MNHTRRLAAILAAVVAGYSPMMSADDLCSVTRDTIAATAR
jgi:hypothetical protein